MKIFILFAIIFFKGWQHEDFYYRLEISEKEIDLWDS